MQRKRQDCKTATMPQNTRTIIRLSHPLTKYRSARRERVIRDYCDRFARTLSHIQMTGTPNATATMSPDQGSCAMTATASSSEPRAITPKTGANKRNTRVRPRELAEREVICRAGAQGIRRQATRADEHRSRESCGRPLLVGDETDARTSSASAPTPPESGLGRRRRLMRWLHHSWVRWLRHDREADPCPVRSARRG